MATSTIKPKRGTTEQWRNSARILEPGEVGVEKTENGGLIMRIGDGEHQFLDLPAVADGTVIGAATEAAVQATEAAEAAQRAAEECREIVDGGGVMILDEETGKKYRVGIAGGLLYIQREGPDDEEEEGGGDDPDDWDDWDDPEGGGMGDGHDDLEGEHGEEMEGE